MIFHGRIKKCYDQISICVAFVSMNYHKVLDIQSLFLFSSIVTSDSVKLGLGKMRDEYIFLTMQYIHTPLTPTLSLFKRFAFRRSKSHSS